MGCPIFMAWSLNSPFGGLSSSDSQVGYALLTHSQVAIIQNRNPVHAAPLLACVKPVASVHPEPGSNSPLYNISYVHTPCLQHRVNAIAFSFCSRRRFYQRAKRYSFLSTVRILLPGNLFFLPISTGKIEASALLYYSRCFMYLYQRTLSSLIPRSLGVSPPSFPKASAKLQPLSDTNQISNKLFSNYFSGMNTPG